MVNQRVGGRDFGGRVKHEVGSAFPVGGQESGRHPQGASGAVSDAFVFEDDCIDVGSGVGPDSCYSDSHVGGVQRVVVIDAWILKQLVAVF